MTPDGTWLAGTVLGGAVGAGVVIGAKMLIERRRFRRAQRIARDRAKLEGNGTIIRLDKVRKRRKTP